MVENYRIILVPGDKFVLSKFNSRVFDVSSDAYVELTISYKILDDSIKEVLKNA